MNVSNALALALLYHAGGKVNGKTRIQKLAFLATEQLKEDEIHPYDFVPYDYGPYAKSLFSSLETLEEYGFVEERTRRTYGGNTRTDYRLTADGERIYEDNLPDDPETDGERRLETIDEVAQDVVSEYNEMPLSNLLELVYDKYPEYAEESVLYL
jgi:uncharacterized protein YwgA